MPGSDRRTWTRCVLGHFNAGFSQQEFTASLVFQASDAFRFKPATRVENACATGSAAVHQAIKTIEARRARTVLVVGVEQMTKTPGPEIGKNLLKASYLPEDGDTPARLRRRLRQHRRASISSATATSPTRSR